MSKLLLTAVFGTATHVRRRGRNTTTGAVRAMANFDPTVEGRVVKNRFQEISEKVDVDRHSQTHSKSRFNTTIELDSRKVTHRLTIVPGQKLVLCRCWKSKKFPICDGLHGTHNRECGDNLGPVVVTAEAEKPVK